MPKRLPFFSLSCLGIAWLLSAASSHADVKMPAIFGNHMVLQQDIKIPVWGIADPGEAVTVKLGDKAAKTKAGPDGKWRVDLDKVATSSTPLTMIVTGKSTLTFEDVLVGDVWVCSGQSNMEFGLNGDSRAPKPQPTNDPQLRLFRVIHKVALEPEKDFVKGTPWDTCVESDRWWKVGGEWKVCDPKDPSMGSISGVGYFFGAELRKTFHKPIGLIGSHWGGTSAEWWISESVVQKNVDKDPGFKEMLDKLAVFKANYAKMVEDYPKQMEVYQAESKKWEEEVGVTWNPLKKAWDEAVKKAREGGQPDPKYPVPSRPQPKLPIDPQFIRETSTLYNGMIAPLMPYAIKGVIWYQGENNHGKSAQYRTLFPLLISDWREKWGQGDFPFLFVQLANFVYRYQPEEPYQKNDDWAGLREAQAQALSLPNTGMAVTIDIGGGTDVHPKDKYDVGWRLAQAAKKVAYGMDVVYSGPTYDAMRIEGNKIRLSFKNVGGGLIFSAAPWDARGKIKEPTELKGFAIAGEDQKFVWAKAQIEGNEVVVSSDQVPNPQAVRYGWFNVTEGWATCNLYNKELLPAVPFRTDAW